MLVVSHVQLFSQVQFGASAGIVMQGGTTISSLGLYASVHAVYSQWQSNMRVAVLQKYSQWAGNPATPELQIGLGIVRAFGTIDSLHVNFDVLANQTGYIQSVGYAHTMYFDTHETSQRTGAIAIQYKEWRVLMENDILGERGSDKFRTAAAAIQYTYFDVELGLETILWTGNFRDPFAKRIKHDTTFCARYGYYDLSETKHGFQSHGILNFHARTTYLYAQQVNIQIGIDAEQIRNVLQNKFLHDAPMLPDSFMKYKNLHFPMITTNGDLYLYKPGQQIREPQLFLQIGTNTNLFY